MKDYTKEIKFWERLESFVSDVQTNCLMGEEEKEMIMHNCYKKIYCTCGSFGIEKVKYCTKCGKVVKLKRLKT